MRRNVFLTKINEYQGHTCVQIRKSSQHMENVNSISAQRVSCLLPVYDPGRASRQPQPRGLNKLGFCPPFA
jgi:hypothetical protein